MLRKGTEIQLSRVHSEKHVTVTRSYKILESVHHSDTSIEDCVPEYVWAGQFMLTMFTAGFLDLYTAFCSPLQFI